MNDKLIEALRASLENFSQDTRADRTEYARLRAVLVLAIAERDAGPELLEALDWALGVITSPNRVMDSRALAQARTAIARAKGVQS